MNHLRTRARCASALAAASVGLLLPSLAAPPASAAGPTAIVTVEPLGHTGAGAAGSCLLYRVVPRDATYEEAVTSAGAGFVTVTVAEVEDPTQQDVDFCATGGRGDTFKTAPKYRAGHTNAAVTQYYNPGETLTPEEAANPVKARQDVAPAVTTTNPAGRPDVAAVEAATSGAPANNLNGTDTAVLAYDAEAGGFVFGIAGLQPGSGRITAFFDKNGDADPDTAAPTPVEPGGDVHAEDSSLRFTSGGAPWSVTAANAVSSLEATPDAATVLAGSSVGAALSVVLRNAEGHGLPGVMPRMAAESGPNSGAAPTWTGSCSVTDGAGKSSCSYAASRTGTDAVALWVNQAGTGRTAGRDAGEPHDVSTIEVTPSSATTPTSPSPAASPIAPASPSPAAPASPSPAQETTAPAPPPCPAVTVSLERAVITASGSTSVRATGAPGKVLRLLAYSRPSTTYRVVREAATDDAGVAVFLVRPMTNTRLYATQDDCPDSAPVVLQVRSAVSLAASRVGVRDYVFRGRALPARSGQTVSLHRLTADGREVLIGRARAASDGTWSLRRAFTGSGRHTFVARTGGDLVNAAGASPARVVDLR